MENPGEQSREIKSGCRNIKSKDIAQNDCVQKKKGLEYLSENGFLPRKSICEKGKERLGS